MRSGFGFGMINRRVGGSAPDTDAPTLSGVGITYAGASDTSFNMVGTSDEATGNMYMKFVTKGAGATAAATIRSTADFSQALTAGTFDKTLTRATLATMMGVQDADVVVEDAATNLSNVVRVTIYNHSAKLVFDAREAITTMTDADKVAMNWWIVGRKGAWTTNQSVFWTNDKQISIPLNGTLAQEMVSWRSPSTKDMTAVNTPSISSAGWANTGTEYVSANTVNSVDLTSTAAFTLEVDRLTDQQSSSAEFGAVQASTKRNFLTPRNASDLLDARFFNNTTGATTIANTNGSGHIIVTKRADNDFQAYRLGVSLGTDATFSGGTITDITDFWGAANSAGTPTMQTTNTHKLFIKHNGGYTANMVADAKELNDYLQTYMGRNITS